MNFKDLVKGSKLNIKVIPNSVKEELAETPDGKLRLYLKAVPEKGKANQAVVKFFKKHYSLKVEIVSGSRSRDKVLLVV